MAKYKILFKASVSKDLRAVPNRDVKRILEKIDTLANNPRGFGAVKLSGQEQYRVRVGVYRIIYEIVKNRLIVRVVKVGHRSDVYRP